MFICGFDIANKSLAISIIEINENFNDDLEHISQKIKSSTNFQQLNQIISELELLLNQRIKLHFIQVKDLFPGQKVASTSILFRTKQLCQYLEEIKSYLPKDCIYLVEYQMGPNDKSRTIASQILLFLNQITQYDNIKIVGPSLKNSIWIQNDENSKYHNFIEKYKSNYTANKSHTKYLLASLSKHYNFQDKLSDIPKKNLDDAADAIIMSIAWFLVKHKPLSQESNKIIII